ncbi:MAG: type II toxin-antitoxin system PemK/MazF family toxin [Ruminococcus flavefaciens]|nr:type II toxin-antitoxin system PemK/MazF family toxin [Ruminococcus flavefaciens]MCM1228559.1 type II toxin-antitoxin system PemK/MazF family toxin [Ruminococcus flavefaciens]
MVKQGDIIKVNFNPQSGHEQAGYRPALVVSNDIINSNTNLVIVCPISNTKNNFRNFPLHVPLDDRTQTTGSVLCQHIKSLDINARGYIFVEKIPDDILRTVIGTIISELK